MQRSTICRVAVMLIAIFVVASRAPAISAQEGATNWYCIRNKDHAQPILDNTLSVIKGHNCIYVDSGRDEGDKVLYLTFDAGYENGNIAAILDTLKESDVKGSFFVLGNLISRNPELIRRMVADGHLVCNHTYSHHDMSAITDFDDFANELNKLNDAFISLCGRELDKFYRPPEGRFSITNLKHAEQLGYTTVFWSFAYADWDNKKQPDAQKALKLILNNIHNGAVILLHPTSATNAQILEELISRLREEGFRFGTLDEITSRA